MGFGIAKLLGFDIKGMAEGVAGAIDTFVETKEEKKAAEMLLMKIQQKPDEWQAQINKIEAGHRSLFVAGWRPFIGWVCGIGLGWQFVGKPIAEFVLRIIIVKYPETPEELLILPAIATGELMTLVMSMLGLGGIRTYEKRHNLTK